MLSRHISRAAAPAHRLLHQARPTRESARFHSQQFSETQTCNAAASSLLGASAALVGMTVGSACLLESKNDSIGGFMTSAITNRPPIEPENSVELSNWSGTHALTAKHVFAPESEQELHDIVQWAHKNKIKIRPLGTGLSPNGVALEQGGMLSLAQLDKIIKVDKKNMTITCQGGARVSTILEELRKHGMTLSNFSSVTEQQIGGWTQTSAHGTGARIPTVDEMITRMKIVTPGLGELELSNDGPNSTMFNLAKVAVGCLGIVSEVTLKCVPSYTLHERMYTSNEKDVRANHAKLLQQYKHVRYMWIPYTDTVVVVVSDEAKPGAVAKEPAVPEAERVKPFKDLLRQLDPSVGNIDDLNFAQLREKCLQHDTLNAQHVARVNKAEAEFWSLSGGERIAGSTEILGFECGGVQWVLENVFPCGTIDKPNLRDIDYLVEIKKTIEKKKIAAASPIEQRWTSSSASPLSPTFSKDPNEIFSWVGVIMYITPEEQEKEIRQKFKEYAMDHADQTFKYDGAFHWAKVDLAFHEGTKRREALRSGYRKRMDIASFQNARDMCDPHNILGNRVCDAIMKP